MSYNKEKMVKRNKNKMNYNTYMDSKSVKIVSRAKKARMAIKNKLHHKKVNQQPQEV